MEGGNNPDQQSGDILTDAHRSIQAGPLILNPQGQVLWFDPLPSGQAGFNLAVQQYAGQSVLTFWQGLVSNGVGSGEDVILNHSYQTVGVVQAANGYHADLHEFQITPQGNAFITAYAPVQADLSSVGGPKNGTLLDAIVQEINIRTGQLLWEWHAYGHVHLAESYAGKPNGNPYDFFHIDSVQPLSNGNVLVSARHMFAVYEINQATGKILWVLGGKHSSFRIGRGANFSWQHDARMQSNTQITLFDDGAGYKKTESQSRGMRISLNTRTRQATLVRQYAHVPPVLSPAEGSVQPLYNGNVFVGFGSNPYFAEYTGARAARPTRPRSATRSSSTGRIAHIGRASRPDRRPWPRPQPAPARPSTPAGTEPRTSPVGGSTPAPAAARCPTWPSSHSAGSRPRSTPRARGRTSASRRSTPRGTFWAPPFP